MVTGAQIPAWSGPSRRRVPRFRVQAPLDVMVTRSGEPDLVPGRSENMCERGVGAVLAGELVPGEIVEVEVALDPGAESLKTQAKVRYHDRLRAGLEFMDLSVAQRNAIRTWAKKILHDVKPSTSPAATLNNVQSERAQDPTDPPSGLTRGRSRHVKRIGIVVGLLTMIIGAVFWWKWSHDWRELESGFTVSDGAPENVVPVATDVMQRLLIHRVEPVYPADARKENVQGIVAVSIIVAQDGSVISARPLNGPEALAQAATDALRWWKFQPYRVNGNPVVVETTMAVEFKK